jgi:hypothetical protein
LRTRNASLTRFTLFFLVFIVAVMYFDVNHRMGRVESAVKVAYIDPLHAENPGFYEDAHMLFSGEGYVFEASLGENVTVEHLRRVAKGYDLIILRVHSTVNHEMVWFFTGEEYRQDKYVLEQLADEVHPARPSLGSRRLFAVGADFVNHFMKDRFRDSTILVMGCDGIRSTDLAQAFIDNGAKLYISWDGPVTLEHTDLAFSCLLRAMTEEGMSPEEAMNYAMNVVGHDPDYDSSLSCFTH